MTNLRITLFGLLALISITVAEAADFETAATAVSKMKVGWNLGNTLDSHSGDLDNMWIERWTQRKPSDYEKAWGQPVTTKELIVMMDFS